MLALCLMLLGTYHAQNYASIIGGCLPRTLTNYHRCNVNNCINKFIICDLKLLCENRPSLMVVIRETLVLKKLIKLKLPALARDRAS